jgi:hypothetical protein
MEETKEEKVKSREEKKENDQKIMIEAAKMCLDYNDRCPFSPREMFLSEKLFAPILVVNRLIDKFVTYYSHWTSGQISFALKIITFLRRGFMEDESHCMAWCAILNSVDDKKQADLFLKMLACRESTRDFLDEICQVYLARKYSSKTAVVNLVDSKYFLRIVNKNNDVKQCFISLLTCNFGHTFSFDEFSKHF